MATRSVSAPVATVTAWGGALLFAVSFVYFLYSYLFTFGVAAPAGSRLVPTVIDVTLFSAFALHHSLFARTPIKAWVSRTIPPQLERSAYTWLASALLIAVCWQWRPIPGELYRLTGIGAALGLAVQATGLILTFIGSRALDTLDLAGVRAVQLARWGGGRGSVALQTTGLYGVVRHPLYFGWALMVLGAPEMTATRAVFAVVSTAYLAIAIPFEERGLVGTFGPAYTAYQAKVRWRMLPGVY